MTDKIWDGEEGVTAQRGDQDRTLTTAGVDGKPCPKRFTRPWVLCSVSASDAHRPRVLTRCSYQSKYGYYIRCGRISSCGCQFQLWQDYFESAIMHDQILISIEISNFGRNLKISETSHRQDNFNKRK